MEREVILTDQLLGVLGIALLRYVVDCRNHAALAKETGWLTDHQVVADEHCHEATQALKLFNHAVVEAMKKAPTLSGNPTLGGHKVEAKNS